VKDYVVFVDVGGKSATLKSRLSANNFGFNRMSMVDYARMVIDMLVEKGETTTDELKKLVPERRLYDILSVLEAIGVVKRGRKKVRWVGGGELVGREVIIQGLVDSVTHSPIEVRIVGVEPLRVKVRGV